MLPSGKFAAVFVFAGIAAAGCASGPPAPPVNPAMIVPYEGGLFTASAFSRTEEGAFRKSLRGAGMACEERGGDLTVIKTTTAFRGLVSREIKESVARIEQVISEGSNAKTLPDLSTDEDYKVTVEFRCPRRAE